MQELKRSASTEVVFAKKRGRSLTAELSQLDLAPVHVAALNAADAVRPIGPAEQLAMLRAEQASRKKKAPREAKETIELNDGWFKEKRPGIGR